MTDCGPTYPPPAETANPPVLVPPPPGRSRLIETPGEGRPIYTGVRECDVVTAVKRGLREYLEQVYLDVLGNRVQFARVTEVWGDTDEVAVYPGLAIMARDEVEYDAASFTPSLDTTPVTALPTDPHDQLTYLVKYAEASIPLVIELHTTSPEERVSCSMLLEDALNPVDWMYGFRLQLPHYFNQIAVFEPVRVQQTDSEDNARRRWRPGSVFLTAHASVVRTRSLPGLRVQASIETTDGSDGTEL